MSIKLTSQNYKEVEYAPVSAILKDAFVPAGAMGGSLNGFTGIAGIAAATPGTVVVKAERAEVTKVAGDSLAFAPGEAVRYNISGAKASKTGSDPLIGWAKKAALAADTSVVIEFDGALAVSAGESVTLAQITDLDDLAITMSQITDLDDLAFADLADGPTGTPTNNDTIKYDTATSRYALVAVTD